MSTRFMQSSGFVLERVAYAVLAAAMGVGLLSIIVAGFGPSLPDSIAGKTVVARMACEQVGAPSTIAQGPVATVTR